MPHALVFTFDALHGLTLVAGESVVTDLTGVSITQQPNGRFECAVSRAQGEAVRLVAAESSEGRLALERANGRECPAVPGFVEVVKPTKDEPKSSLRDDIARAFGWSPDAAA